MKIYIPFHVGSGNRGCEGILRGTANILKLSKEDILALDRDQSDFELDQKLKLNNIVDLKVKVERNLMLKLMGKLGINMERYYVSPFVSFFKSDNTDSLCLFTGGDLFCYDSTIKENCFLLDYLTDRGIKSILWGASIEAHYITAKIEKQLNRFEKIVCRETETKKILEKHSIENVFCYPDPAFTLEPQECELPSMFYCFKVIGLNISSMVNDNSFSLNTPFIKNLTNMIEFILKETDYRILLIPHVTWERQDDRRICREVKKIYAAEERIDILNVDNLGYLQIRNIISNCHMFIGGRTHSVISAYSTCVPALALGYSIKAKGISTDLGLDNKLIFDTKNIHHDDELLICFKHLIDNRDMILAQLQRIMAKYKKSAFASYDVLKDYFD